MTNQIKRNNKKAIKDEVWLKTDGVCAHCGKPAPQARRTIDHFIPKSKGGTDDMRNLVPLCKNCNKQKAYHTVDIETYYPHLKPQAIAAAKEYEVSYGTMQSMLP